MAKQNDNKSGGLIATANVVVAIKQSLTDKSSKKGVFRMHQRAATQITICTILVLILVELASCTAATADVSNSNYYSGSNENLGEFLSLF